MSDRDFARIESLHNDLEHYYSVRDHKTYLQRNHALHELIEDIASNPVLKQVIDGLRHQIILYRIMQLYRGYRFEESIQEHRDLLEAFRKRDAGLAEIVMRQHLINQCKALADTSMPDKSGGGGKGRSG